MESPELCNVHEWPLIRAVDIFGRISDCEDDIAAITADTEQTDVLLKFKFVGLTFLYSGGKQHLQQWKISISLRYLRSKTNDMILKNSSKLHKNLMKTKLFVKKLILATFGDINVNENHFSEANEMFWMLNWLLLRQNV